METSVLVLRTPGSPWIFLEDDGGGDLPGFRDTGHHVPSPAKDRCPGHLADPRETFVDARGGSGLRLDVDVAGPSDDLRCGQAAETDDAEPIRGHDGRREGAVDPLDHLDLRQHAGTDGREVGSVDQ